MNDIEKHFLAFLNEHGGESPLLLALSGGPDSMVLYHLLVKHRRGAFGVAHVHHGWRFESDGEAAFLAKMCREAAVPYFERRLKKEGEANLEEKGRIARYEFFADICSTQMFGAVMLAHHGDDQAETVLKRVFEGASLYNLKGLQPVSNWEETTLLRPLLKVSKGEILQWLQERSLPYFVDKTNEDPRFLRTRLRQTLLPYLSMHFGKNVTSSLVKLGHSAAELSEFLQIILAPYRALYQRTSEGFVLDFGALMPKSAFEWKVVIKDFLKNQGVVTSGSTLDALIFHLKARGRDKEIITSSQRFVIDKGVLYSYPLKEKVKVGYDGDLDETS